MKKLIFGSQDDKEAYANEISRGTARLVDLNTSEGKNIARDFGITEPTIIEVDDMGCRAITSRGREVLSEDKCNIIRKALEE